MITPLHGSQFSGRVAAPGIGSSRPPRIDSRSPAGGFTDAVPGARSGYDSVQSVVKIVIRRSLILVVTAQTLFGQQPARRQPAAVRSFISTNCAPCHNSNFKQGNLDLTTLAFNPGDAANF